MRRNNVGILFAILFSCVTGHGSDEKHWTDLPHGLQTKEIKTSQLSLTVVRFEAKHKVQVVILDLYRLLDEGTKPYPAYTLGEAFDLMRPKAAINGGFSKSATFPFPDGLLVTDGVLVSQLNHDLSGIFCAKPAPNTQKRAFVILKTEDFKEGICEFAVQGNPLVVENGSVSINPTEANSTPYERSLVAIDGSGRVYLIHSTAAHLLDIAKLITLPEAAGGVGCEWALNLSGDIQSGLKLDNSRVVTKGHLDVPISSVIAIFEKGDYSKRRLQLKKLKR